MPGDRVRPERPHERGFTLLETLVALAVLGVVLVTLFRLAGDTLTQYRGREARLGLALAAETAFNAERLEAGSAAGYTWPPGVAVAVERRELAGVAAPEGVVAVAGGFAGDLDWLSVRAVDADGRSFVLEGAVTRVAP